MSNFDNVETQFDYLVWSELYKQERPFQTFLDIPKNSPDQRRHNLVFAKGKIQIVQDVRNHESDFTLDVQGFLYKKHTTALRPLDFKDKTSIESVYLPECAELLKKELDGADEVFIFDWRLRRMDFDKTPGRLIDYNDALRQVGPTARVHVDQSIEGAMRRLRLHFADTADEKLSGRVRIVKRSSMWRPLNGPVKDCPLAVCDGRSVKETSFVETDHIKPQFTACTQHLLYNSGMKWYYMSNQQNDELLVFKNYDSRESVTRCKSCCPKLLYQRNCPNRHRCTTLCIHTY